MTITRKAVLTPTVALGLAALGLAAMPQAHAQTTFTAASPTTQSSGGSGDYSMGFTFTPTQNLYVTAVGALNNGNLAHNVQVYSVTSATAPTTGVSVIGQVSVPTTINDTTGSTFTYTALAAPVLLSSGTTYEIVDSVNGTFYQNNATPVSPYITVGGGFYTGTTGATATATPVATTAYAGLFDPNFKFSLVNPAATPEPSQSASFGLGLLGLSGLALKARKRRPVSV